VHRAADDDARLVEAARRGSRDAAGALVERHWRDAWRVARGITGDAGTAEEVAQESLIAALGALDRFDPARGAFGAWLHRIAVNWSLNAVRRERRHRGLDAAGDLAAAPAEDEDARFLEAIADLSPAHRAVLVLRFGLGRSPAEIAEVLEVPAGTVHSRTARALDALRQTMESPRA
jgi:RNA polymerase sigma factor (sigma-70 family)